MAALPKVTNVSNAPFPSTVMVYFDSEMLNDSELIDTSNYLFDHGAYATDVLVVDGHQVMLIVQNLYEQDDFSVTVQNVRSAAGEVDPNFNSGSFVVSRPNMPGFVLAISATNGRLKSGVHAIKISESDDSWYVMTESGVDVISRVSLMNSGFILDEEGFNTIHVG